MDDSAALNANLRECIVLQPCSQDNLFTHTCGQDGASQKYSKPQLKKSETENKITDPALIYTESSKKVITVKTGQAFTSGLIISLLQIQFLESFQ